MHRIHRRIILPTTLERAWEFFSNPRNLSQITPPALQLSIASEPATEMYAGMLIEYTVRPFFGIPLTWISEITHVEPNRYFIDEQRVGPYRLWHHEHRFHACDAGVEVVDTIEYLLPLGLIGRLLNRVIVSSKLAEIFDYRAMAFSRTFGPRSGNTENGAFQ